jgi:uncharacterized protein DUF1552
MKALSRRTVLRGMGVTLSLPLLDAMFPAFGEGTVKPAKRFQAIYVPNGMAMEYWSPTKEGADFEITPILEPLAPFKNQMLVLSGLQSSWNYVHAGASTSFLTGTLRGGKTEVEIIADVSVDQLMARKFAADTQVGSLELSMDAPNHAGACTGKLSCAYTHTISWRSATQPLPMEHNPRAVFEKLFGDTGSTERKARETRLHQHKSILDSVTEKLADLKREVGSQDNHKVDEYTEAVRDVERRVQKAEEQSAMELPRMDQPQGVPPSFEEHMDLMQDLQILALRTDLTRVITFMIGKEQSARSYPQIGVPESHHPLSHHNNQPAVVKQMSKINRYHTEILAKYIGKLKAVPDGDGSLFDHMIMMYGTGLSNSNAHSPMNVPTLILGGGAGTLKGGRHVKYTNQPTSADLLVTLMDKMDMHMDKVGGSKGKVQLDPLPGV